MQDEKVEVLYLLITELEEIGCFEIKTNKQERREIAKLLIEIIEKNSEDELLSKMSGRWT